jgi:hypothetical protein
MNGIALAAFTTAVIIILYNKSAHGAAHFTTAHGMIGLITYILLLLQVLVFSLRLAYQDNGWRPDVLLPSSIRISREREVDLEISSSQWICCVDVSPRELCPRNAEYMVP